MSGQRDPPGLRSSQLTHRSPEALPQQVCRRSPGRWRVNEVLLHGAYIAASIRVCNWSFSRMLRTWFFTVFSEMNNSRPISRLPRPGHQAEHLDLAIRELGQVAVDDPWDVVACYPRNSASSLEAMDGEMSESPLCTARMPAVISLSPGTSLEDVPVGQRAHRFEEIRLLIDIVNMTMRAGRHPLSDRLAGLDASAARHSTSMRTTSGTVASAFSTAAMPSSASPTMTMSPSSSRTVRRPRLKSAWSSAMSTRIGWSLSHTWRIFRFALLM